MRRELRPACQSDVPALLAIYNHYVTETHVTFDLEARTLADRMQWFSQFAQTGRYQCLVAEECGKVIGWTCSSRFRERAAYETSVETTVYLALGQSGRGVGSELYQTLFAALAREDVHRAYGAIAAPNPGSVRLHEKLGFEKVGSYREVGRKFGRFWDVDVYERAFGKGLATSEPP